MLSPGLTAHCCRRPCSLRYRSNATLFHMTDRADVGKPATRQPDGQYEMQGFKEAQHAEEKWHTS